MCCFFFRNSRQTLTDLNTEPSQNEQIIWDDPTAREERAKLASNLQWPNSPSQCTEPLLHQKGQVTDSSHFKESLTDTEIAEMGKGSWHLVLKILYPDHWCNFFYLFFTLNFRGM